jgi:hypothetical protein
MQTIFHKTQTGSEEIASRAHGLSARLRRCLILIDGKRTLADLKTVLSSDNVYEMLAELLAEGLIEGDSESRPSGNIAGNPPIPVLQMQAASDFLDTEVDSPSSITPAQAAARRPLSMPERRHRGVRIVQDVLGPMGEDIAVKMERCQDDASLNVQLEKAYLYIKELRSKAAADKFRGDVRLVPY